MAVITCVDEENILVTPRDIVFGGSGRAAAARIIGPSADRRLEGTDAAVTDTTEPTLPPPGTGTTASGATPQNGAKKGPRRPFVLWRVISRTPPTRRDTHRPVKRSDPDPVRKVVLYKNLEGFKSP